MLDFQKTGPQKTTGLRSTLVVLVACFTRSQFSGFDSGCNPLKYLRPVLG